MGLLRTALIGAAVAYGINHITKKRENGTSILDDLREQAPGWAEKAKNYAQQTVGDVKAQAAAATATDNYNNTPPY
ncbi:YtxH domain-containing protein [Mucilaginibacter myungsuensis]|uniref:YtxH domain-containing protein n=1 Tax=Mucilaginibacter myungsuensis TaxID=649104 RepID=A0A929PX18_9SPHI|nr:YtxH domain-containing protein [Mucilaginibacter myungsuensis]MBE9661925.1 YtxH domain-containing protein [Mucilaginibacter myungsuensis]MDN3599641.1 YtxH domain-containing protein [Mucilaginibacter myungsuensis]